MNVVIINTYDISGGAAKAAYRLNKGMNLIGINSTMLTRYKKSDDPRVIKIEQHLSKENLITKDIFSDIQINYINNNRTALSNTIFKIPYPGVSLKSHPVIINADIINLHWVADFLSVESIEELLSLGKPVVWTLHDQWPITGGCHYASGCNKYKTNCKGCPQLDDDPYYFPSLVLKNKLRHLQKPNLSLITPSRWLADVANESKLFNNTDVRVIPNAIEDDIYFPADKESVRKELGIPTDNITLYFSSYSAKVKIKGFAYLVDSIDHCLKNTRFKSLVDDKKVMILLAGFPSDELEKLNIPYTSFGYLESDISMAKLYNAADLLLLPSLEENLPNLMLESFACGTPVIAFNAGGMPEFIDNHKTGRIVPLKNIEAFGDAILELVFNENLRREMGRHCREKIIKGFGLDKQANEYRSLFEELISQNKSKRGNVKEAVDEISLSEDFISDYNEKIDYNIFPLYKKYAIGIIQKKNELITDIKSKIAAADKQVKEKNNLIKKSGENVRQLNEQLIEKRKQISEKDKIISQKEEIISDQQEGLHQKDEVISQKDDIIVEQKKYIQQRNHLIKEKDSIIDEKSHELQRSSSALRREKELLKQTNGKLNVALKEISHQKQEISNLYNSYSWKIGWGIIRVLRFFFFWMRKKSK
ncbi:MAG: glycosyltransferase [Bacteroidales bacterium]|nr:glycosyltransferase [Bacteroidales bacterium]